MACGSSRPVLLSFAKPGRFLLFVQNAIVAAAQRLGHDQPDAVGADIDRRQPEGELGREKELLFFHAVSSSGQCHAESIQKDTIRGPRWASSLRGACSRHAG